MNFKKLFFFALKVIMLLLLENFTSFLLAKLFLKKILNKTIIFGINYKQSYKNRIKLSI